MQPLNLNDALCRCRTCPHLKPGGLCTSNSLHPVHTTLVTACNQPEGPLTPHGPQKPFADPPPAPARIRRRKTADNSTPLLDVHNHQAGHLPNRKRWTS